MNTPWRATACLPGPLIDCLAGRSVAKQDGYVRALDLALYARQNVPVWSKSRQTPIADIEKADNFIVAYYAAGAKAPLPLDLPPIEPDPIEPLDHLPAAVAGSINTGIINTGGGAYIGGSIHIG